MRAVRCPYSRPTLSFSLSSRSSSSSSQPTSLKRIYNACGQPSSSSSLGLRTQWAKHQPARAITTNTIQAPRAAQFDGPPPDFSRDDAVDVAVEGSIEGFDQLNPWPQTEEDDDEALRDDERQSEEQERSLTAVQRPPPDEVPNPVVQRFERLIAYRLALQMLLQLQLGGRPRYRDLYDMRSHREGYNSRKVATIMQRLQQVTTDLDAMRDVPVRRLQWGLDRGKAPPEVVRLNNQLFHLMDQYKTRGLTVEGLVDRFATIVMESGATPDNRTYTQMIQLFGQVNREDLIYLVLSALHDSALALDVHTIHAVLWSYATTRDVRMFDAFLADLTRTNGRSINPWEWRRINGTLVPVPSIFSSVTTLRLIAVALSCDQPDRAEAWATLMAEEKPLSVRRLTMMKNFLRYYTYQQNWQRGKLWIAEIIAFASNWDHLRPGRRTKPEEEIRLAILRMLHVSYSCWKPGVYDTIMAAAVKHAIDPPRLPLQFYSRSAKHVHSEWVDASSGGNGDGKSPDELHAKQEQQQQQQSQSQPLPPFGERVKAFAAQLAPLAEELSSDFEAIESAKPGRRRGDNGSPFVFISANNNNTTAPTTPTTPTPTTTPATTTATTTATTATTDHAELINAQQSRIQALEAELARSKQTAEQERAQWQRDKQAMLDTAARYEQQFDRLIQKLDALKRESTL